MLVGKDAPDWQANAYHDGREVELSSEDFRGRWHVLYFYPLDFTFICPTEIVGFEALQEEFEAEDITVIGASTDSFYSHRAWFKDQSVFPGGVSHPVLADTNHSVAAAFDVLKSDAGVAYRATVIIDDQGIVRSVTVNDLDAGRSPEETLRTAIALQSGGLCPAGWTKGQAFAA
ncbi:MAG: peroxiredoxin [Pseudomonadota bacterium]